MQAGWTTIIWVLAGLSPILVAIIAGIGWLYRHEKERREAVERQLSEHKYKAYITLLDIFFGAMKDTKAGKTVDQSDLFNRMFDASKDLILYGSDDVVNTYQKWILMARAGKINFGQFGEIVISIRRDMGNPKTKVTSEAVLRQIFVDYEDAKRKGLI